MTSDTTKGNAKYASTDGDVAHFPMYIDGEWVDSEGGDTYSTIDPATGETIGTLPAGTRADAQRAIDAARDVQKDLEFMTAFERADLCHEIADAIEDRREWLAEWLSRDQGKPLATEAIAEVDQCVRKFRDAAEDIKRIETSVIASEDPNKRIFTTRKPHGVYGAITPWNFPLGIPCEYLAFGLAAGNSIVWVSAPTTSVVASKLMEVLDETSLPEGAINHVTGEGAVVGDELVVNDGTDAIAFTGSPETGETIAERAGTKPTLLELGGNGPVVVLDDADVDAAVEGAAMGCFLNSGQTCTASERILVHEDVHDEFVEKLTAQAESVRQGDPTEEGTDMGPLNNEEVATKMDEHIADAVEKGARLVTGGSRREDTDSTLYYQPTVVDDVTEGMLVNEAETFGPIAPIVTFSDYDEALELANASEFGLNSAVFTSNIELMYYFAERLETGITVVNDGSVYWEVHTPIGGYTGTKSGVGREGGKYTIEEMSQVKNVIVDIGNADSPL